MAKNLTSKINNEEFIGLLSTRPALWQKVHPDFQNRDVRDSLLREMAEELRATVSEVKDRLKALKDSMRKQVNSLPKTKSGAPAFEMSSQITWPYFTKLLFMKDEFIGRKMTSSHPEDAQCSGHDYDNQSIDDIDNNHDEEDLLEQALEASGMPSVEKRCPRRASATSASEGSHSKRRRYSKACSDNIEQEKLNLLKESFAISKQKLQETKDPLKVFAMDLANDLKKIEDRKLLIQTKLELKQITSKALLKQIDTVCVEGASQVQQTYQTDTNYVQGASNIHRAYETHVPTYQLQDPTDLSVYSSSVYNSEKC